MDLSGASHLPDHVVWDFNQRNGDGKVFQTQPPALTPSTQRNAHSAKSTWKGRVHGEVKWVSSPIEPKGVAVSPDGLQGHITSKLAAPQMLGQKGFTLAAWIRPIDLLSSVLAAQLEDDKNPGWLLTMNKHGSVRFGRDATDIDLPENGLRSDSQQILPGQWYHLAVSARPDGLATLFINGESVASRKIDWSHDARDATPLMIGRGPSSERSFHGAIDNVRLHWDTLTRKEIRQLIKASYPGFLPPARTRHPFEKGWTLSPHDTIVVTGGENMVALHEHGYFETLLRVGSTTEDFRVRNMAWEGDTVFEQWRDLNFGTWERQLESVDTTIGIASFGQMEVLQDDRGLEAFLDAYAKLMNKFAYQTKRWVLLSPTPFETTRPHMPDLEQKNPKLKRYVNAIRELASSRKALFVDLFHPLRNRFANEDSLTRDGIHWNARGHWVVAQEIIRQLQGKMPATHIRLSRSSGQISPPMIETLRRSVVQKNRLWFHYWRPTNWAFLQGDRTEQPSSRDYRNPRFRWFPEERQQFKDLILKEEKTIRQQARRAVRSAAQKAADTE